jgi:signal transduction histidine kinase/DNA-binding NarL/FixJ family response regulator/HPt (histidine-containing phosphotransfer) domain-containing protein
VLLFVLCVLCPTARAQETPAAMRFVPDPGRNLTLANLSGQGGQILGGETQGPVLVSAAQGPFWLVFDARGAEDRDFFLDFGGLLEGRVGFMRGLAIYILDRQTGAPLGKTHLGGVGSWAGRRIPIPTHSLEQKAFRVAIFVEPEPGTPVSPRFTPRLVPGAPVPMPPLPIAWALAFAIVGGALFSMGLLRRWVAAWALAVHYMAWGALALLLSAVLVGPPNAPLVAFLLVGLVGLSALAACALFLWRTHRAQSGLFVLAAAGVLAALAALAGGLLPGPNSPALFGAALLLPPVGAAIATAVTALLKDNRALWAPFGGWLASALGTLGAMFWPLPTGAWTLAAGLAVQGVLFTVGLLLWDLAMRRRAVLLRRQKLRRAQALAQVKREEESQGQAHLLRTIERERALMAELREREHDRTEQMRLAKEAADEANRAKSAFLAVVSHEIRTPMTGVLGMLRLLEGSGLTREQKDYVTTMRRSGDTMMKLLNDILDLEKVGSGQMEMEAIDFDLSQLIESVVTLMSAHAAEKGLYLKAECAQSLPRYVVGDPARLRQVFLNLVSNAIKFTAKGGITISARLAAEGGITFAVRDTGIGIPPEAQERLFVPFAQAESSTSRKYGGTGLGLAICKQIIAAMGSEIHIESTPRRGTAFFFTLTLPEGQADRAYTDAPDAEEELHAPPVPSMRILVVEDNAVNQKIVCSLLEAHAHRPTPTPTAEAALDLARKEAFDAILMDVNLGGINGLEATRALRAMPMAASANAPVIALTGNVGEASVRACYAAGMNGFVSKPVRPLELYEALAKVHEGRLDSPLSRQEDGEVDPADSDLTLDFVLAPNAQTLGAEPYRTAQEIWGDLSRDPEPEAKAPPPAPSTTGALSLPMLRSLAESVGRDHVLALMEGFWDKAQELIAAITTAAAKGDGPAMGARGHELKGMAGNFGMEALSQIAAQIERTAKIGQAEEAAALAERLPEALHTAHTAFDQWVDRES